MSLNSHLQRQSRAFAVRSVLIDEITEGYEKLHATVSLEILYQPMDQFRFAVPEGFEITEITSPLLARWDVQEVAGKKVVNVKLREQTNETVVLNLIGAAHAQPAGGVAIARIAAAAVRRRPVGGDRAGGDRRACWSKIGSSRNRSKPTG